MSRDRLERPSSRRKFLAQLLVPAAAAAASTPLASALAQAAAAKSPKKAVAAKPAPAPSPFASAGPDVSIAKTATERATLEKQWKSMVDALESIRKIELPEGAAPALSFAALARDGGDDKRKT